MGDTLIKKNSGTVNVVVCCFYGKNQFARSQKIMQKILRLDLFSLYHDGADLTIRSVVTDFMFSSCVVWHISLFSPCYPSLRRAS